MGGTETLTTVVTLPSILFFFLFLKISLIIYSTDILRKYNINLYGQSVGNGNQNSANARFNVAKPGAVSV